MNTTGHIGVIPPPPGAALDFDHPQDAGYIANVVIMGVILFIITIFMAIQYYVKVCVVRRLSNEDFVCVLTWFSLVLYILTVLMMTRHGAGYHAWEVDIQQYSEILKWIYAGSIVYAVAAYSVKLTLLLLIARVFATKQQIARGIRIYIYFLLLCYIPLLSMKTAICIPISDYWRPTVDDAKCLPQRKLFLADVSLALVTEFIALAIPVALVWSMNVPMKRKIKIASMLGIGSVATSVTCVRMWLMVDFQDSLDVTADFVPIDITTTFELTIGFVCGCLPAVNLLFEKDVVAPNRRVHPKMEYILKKWRLLPKRGRYRFHINARNPVDNNPATQSNFNVELAVLSGTMNAKRTEQRGADDVRFPSTNQGLTTTEGMREGWLRPSPQELRTLPLVPPIRLSRLPTQGSTSSRLQRLSEAIWDGTAQGDVEMQSGLT